MYDRKYKLIFLIFTDSNLEFFQTRKIYNKQIRFNASIKCNYKKDCPYYRLILIFKKTFTIKLY